MLDTKKKERWSLIYKIAITLLTSLAGILGLASCMAGDPTQAVCATTCATTALLLQA